MEVALVESDAEFSAHDNQAIAHAEQMAELQGHIKSMALANDKQAIAHTKQVAELQGRIESMALELKGAESEFNKMLMLFCCASSQLAYHVCQQANQGLEGFALAVVQQPNSALNTLLARLDKYAFKRPSRLWCLNTVRGEFIVL
jgi:hypothetical protein